MSEDLEFEFEENPNLDPPSKKNIFIINSEEFEIPKINKPVIRLTGGDLDRSITMAELCLISQNKYIFKRGKSIVTPINQTIKVENGEEISIVQIVEVDVYRMIDLFTSVIDFQIFDKRLKTWKKINCPEELARVYLSRKGEWTLPALTSVINTPTLRPDGSVLEELGYDKQTGILLVPSETFSPIPQFPTYSQAKDALDFLKNPISQFPFVPDNELLPHISSSRSVILSAFLTSLIRQSIPNAPLHAFTAPTMGSGKSKLINIVSMLATGHEAIMISQGGNEIETEKRLGTELMAGNNQIVFDNCTTPIGGQLFCQAVSEETLTIRILGQSKRAMIPNRAMFFANGNNLIIEEDMTRRSILCSIDPKVEKPELRPFSFEPIQTIKENRVKYVTAALTIIRAHLNYNLNSQKSIPLGSFETWSKWIRDALIWLDEPDPCLTMKKIREKDPPLNQLKTILAQWNLNIGPKPITAKNLIKFATDHQKISALLPPKKDQEKDQEKKNQEEKNSFRDALFSIAEKNGFINPQRLGLWLNKNEGRVVNNMRIIDSGEKQENTVLWVLETIVNENVVESETLKHPDTEGT